jgi:hypothetical protein
LGRQIRKEEKKSPHKQRQKNTKISISSLPEIGNEKKTNTKQKLNPA